MNAYTSLAAYYDSLMDPEVYRRFCEVLCTELARADIRDGLVLDLCCGTGTLTRLLSLRGYEMIGCDASPEMLDIAREKCRALEVPPVWICQRADELDLYGTVRAAVCCMDSVNYLTGLRELKRAFSLVSLFLEPGGVFLFDVKSREMFEALAGTASVQEDEESFSSWQYGFDRRSGRAFHQVDLFRQDGDKYIRFTEAHEQRFYSTDTLRQALHGAGLRLKRVSRALSGSKEEEPRGRLLFIAEKPLA